jgi:hypothetical protein
VVPEERHPSAEGPRNARGEQTCAGDVIQAEGPDGVDGSRTRDWALATNHLGATARGVPEEDGDLAAQSIQVRFYHLKYEARGDRGVESIPALFKDGHPALRCEPVR